LRAGGDSRAEAGHLPDKNGTAVDAGSDAPVFLKKGCDVPSYDKTEGYTGAFCDIVLN
jgi:hypothetical protein